LATVGSMELKLPRIPESERTPLVEELLAIIDAEREKNQKVENERKEWQAEKEKLENEQKKLEAEKKRLNYELDRLRKRLAQYEPEIWYEGKPNKSTRKTSSPSFSMDAENKRRQGPRRHKKNKSSGRQATEVKVGIAERTEDVYPDGVRHADCHLVRERAVWRLENHRAVLIAYRIFAGPGGNEGRIPGVTPRCEYGIEILVVLAYLVYIIGVSLDKSCQVLGFFCGLWVRKSQADALLRQLAKHWDAEFDAICALMSHAAIVYMDETGWKVGDQNCSMWAFASELQRLFLFGCHKDDATLDKILPPDVFQGVGVSDDAAVYRDRFKQAQKCWAHPLRKTIKLAMLYPRKQKYRQFLEELLALFNDAKRAAADRRLGDAGRERRVSELEGRLSALCQPYMREPTPDMKPPEHDFTNLVNELVRMMLDEELFTFVLVEGVEPTNNCSERQVRDSVLDRKAGRTNKTPAGAHRRSVIVSVLESLRASLEQFTFASVLEEVTSWMREGKSLFAKQWQKIIEAQPGSAVPNTS
jgi:transposase